MIYNVFVNLYILMYKAKTIMSEKTHFKKAFNTPYLGSQDLEDYKDINLIIEKVVLATSKGLKENKKFNIAYFKNKGVKPMLLNATNCKTIRKLSGGSPYIDDWKNIEVTVYVAVVNAFGEDHDALRIREVTRKSVKPVLDENHKKWKQAVESVKNGETDRKSISKHYQISDENWDKLYKLAGK